MNKAISSLAGGCFLLAIALVGCAQNSQPAITASQLDSGIIGGTDATGTEDFAKTVVMLYNTAEGSLCTASIISDTNLVTAAHCVSGPASTIRVIFGLDINDKQNRIVRAIDSYEINPIYSFRQAESLNTGDIAVVKFSGGLPTGYQAAPILQDKTVLQNGATIRVAGYGITDGVTHAGAGKLRYADTTILNANFSESEILIEQHNGRGACHGDSGGPAYVNVNGQWMLWGVTNRGVNDTKNDCTVSASYASIPYYTDWVVKTVNSLNQGRSDLASGYYF